MKSTVFALALSAAGLATIPAISHAADGDHGGFFVNGNIGRSDLSKGVYNDNDTGYGVNLGYRWALSPYVALGVEGGYTDLGSFSPSSAYAGQGISNAKVHGWTAGVNGHFNLSPEWYVSARGGLFRGDVKAAYLPGATPVYVDDTSNKYYAGVGFGYDFSTNASIGLNYDYYKTDTHGLNLDPDIVSVSAEYRF